MFLKALEGCYWKSRLCFYARSLTNPAIYLYSNYIYIFRILKVFFMYAQEKISLRKCFFLDEGHFPKSFSFSPISISISWMRIFFLFQSDKKDFIYFSCMGRFFKFYIYTYLNIHILNLLICFISLLKNDLSFLK